MKEECLARTLLRWCRITGTLLVPIEEENEIDIVDDTFTSLSNSPLLKIKNSEAQDRFKSRLRECNSYVEPLRVSFKKIEDEVILVSFDATLASSNPVNVPTNLL